LRLREHRLDRSRRTSEAAFTAIDEVLQDSRYLEYLDVAGLSTWDVCYAVLTIADWWMDSKEYALRLKVE
jgi:hypothetical protein